MGVKRPEELAGKAVLVTTNSPGPAPRIVIRWKDEQHEPVTEHIHAGYAMSLDLERSRTIEFAGGFSLLYPTSKRALRRALSKRKLSIRFSRWPASSFKKGGCFDPFYS